MFGSRLGIGNGRFFSVPLFVGGFLGEVWFFVGGGEGFPSGGDFGHGFAHGTVVEFGEDGFVVGSLVELEGGFGFGYGHFGGNWMLEQVG